MKRPYGIALLGLGLLLLIGVGYGVYVVGQNKTTPAINAELIEYEDLIATYYAPLTPFTISDDTLQVSIADTIETRSQGLSNTPMLPPGLGKLFVFDVSDTWSFWMKDMLYQLDIVWLDEERRIVHIESHVAPETYPDTVKPPVPARYVLEVNAGVSDSLGWVVGDQAAW